MLVDTSNNLTTPNVPVSLTTDINTQCPYCGVYPGQYHHPDCANGIKADSEKEGQG